MAKKYVNEINDNSPAKLAQIIIIWKFHKKTPNKLIGQTVMKYSKLIPLMVIFLRLQKLI